MTQPGGRGLAAALALLLSGCSLAPVPPASGTLAASRPAEHCAAGRPAPLLDAVLAGSGLTRHHLGIDARALRVSPYHDSGVLEDAQRPPLLELAFDDPWQLGCAHDTLVRQLDRAAGGATPGADLLTAIATLLAGNTPPAIAPHGQALNKFRACLRSRDGPPFRARMRSKCEEGGNRAFRRPKLNESMDGLVQRFLRPGWSAALERLCDNAGCGQPDGELSQGLAEALGPVIAAAKAAADARTARFARAGLVPSIAWDTAPGDTYRVMFGPALLPPFHAAATHRLFHGPAAQDFHAAAITLARAVEQARLQRFAGLTGIAYDLVTPLGRVRVRDGADHVHDDTDGPFLLLVDLGGNDRYLGASAATRPGHPVSLLVDVAGDDHYGYPGSDEVVPHPLLLPDDGHGRAPDGPPRTLSVQGRQAAARDGVAMLFDLAGDDHYRSLVQSQGYAALGVALLLDAGGDDLYEAELLAQGAAVLGLAVAADLGGGDDRRLVFSGAQGFAHHGGAALLYDDGGDDRYHCPGGLREHGGMMLYPSSQLPGRGNLSFCQGAGFGIRADRERIWRAGGVGVLRDRAGDDHYTASVYAQGAGYWQGAGVLADGGGNDRYDGDWYVQGAAAHYALGMLADAGGDDVYGGGWPVTNMQAGAGHDFGVGMLVDESGEDRYELGALAGGASNCNGRGVFVDNAGNDLYRASSELSLGLGGIAPECRPHREGSPSIGIMLDAGGRDRYRTPGGARPLPEDDARFGHARDHLPAEFGLGLDGEGETGLHVAPPGS